MKAKDKTEIGIQFVNDKVCEGERFIGSGHGDGGVRGGWIFTSLSFLLERGIQIVKRNRACLHGRGRVCV